jgi:predicted RNA-binding Zn ribbon-like protein
MTMEPAAAQFAFVGERLCIDFVNTEVVEAGERRDLLADERRLLDWCVAADIVSASEVRAVAHRLQRGGRSALPPAVRFRTSLRSMLDRFAHGKTTIAQELLDEVNRVLADDGAVREIVRTKTGFETRVRRTFVEPGQLLVPIAESVADLLSEGDLTLVKKCQNPQCILFFYDTTKNHGRRWCSMTGCGNRAKVAAHYQRARAAATATSAR